jgi:hypothetical protein
LAVTQNEQSLCFWLVVALDDALRTKIEYLQLQQRLIETQVRFLATQEKLMENVQAGTEKSPAH